MAMIARRNPPTGRSGKLSFKGDPGLPGPNACRPYPVSPSRLVGNGSAKVTVYPGGYRMTRESSRARYSPPTNASPEENRAGCLCEIRPGKGVGHHPEFSCGRGLDEGIHGEVVHRHLPGRPDSLPVQPIAASVPRSSGR